ncbi:gamma subclass chorismate mutase AroQ [Nakamurella flava]|uniref:chorismate mutase n=1 Tax=Nakamurella flava TaxID=2576308 RepID=A0A4U6QM45_9ACTN|nr:gamma subclass chorismate mutase AroQ [Nakamurella flava]TKV61399.1 gamma subclass chorismate mutase AroQ [Nakamurella flava]
MAGRRTRHAVVAVLGAALVTTGATGCGGSVAATSATSGVPASLTSSGTPPSSPDVPTAVPAGQPTPADVPPEGAFDPVLALMVQRLDTADTVAAAKWVTQQPVTDPAREAVVLAAAPARAEQVGADLDYVTAVFGDQITANKQAQQQILDGWTAGSGTPPTTAPDLATQVRPVLDRITTDLVPALAAVQDYRDDSGCAKFLADDVASVPPPASDAGRAALPTAVAHLCDG